MSNFYYLEEDAY